MPGMSETSAVIAITARGLDTARRIAAQLDNCRVHGYSPRVSSADVLFDNVGAELRRLFETGTPIIGVCAAGILIRTLAPLIASKHDEPPVLAVAEDGSAVVPLLGGHHGANTLATRIGEVFGIQAAVTTSSEVRWRVALDQPPPGWVLANPGHHKAFVAALIAGEGCRLEGEAPWLAESGIGLNEQGPLALVITDAPTPGDERTLVYHPQRFALGVGCERGASAAELLGLVQNTLQAANLSAESLAGVFSVDVKADEPAVHALGETLGLPVRFFEPDTLERLTPRLEHPSEVVFREVGCHGVAEAAALAAGGEQATLRVAKTKSKRATAAIAEAPAPINAAAAGKARGLLTVVGLGPGTVDWRTPAADRAIREATHLVGYHGYLAMLEPDADHIVHRYPLGEETERVDQALALAADGERVALICSGDPGVYAMAALVFERQEVATETAWKRSEVVVLPGVSAMHGAAALTGAPLGHDFCAVSLSDLLTPWPVIENRLEAAARGDFVTALYNPASNRRREGLARAVEIFAQHRSPETPVIVARQVGRDDQSVTVTCLKALDQTSVDMMTLLIIGSTTTRLSGEHVYTPRGYSDKQRQEKSA